MVEPEGEHELAMGLGYYMVAVGESCGLHYHQRKAETWFIISGRGELTLGGTSQEVTAGTAIFTPPGTPHALRNIGEEPLVFVDVTYPRIGRHPETGKPLDSIDLE